MPIRFRNYYTTLGVRRNATQEEIQKAFRRMARIFHPDVSQSSDAENKIKEINEAYEVLKDPDKRRKYDAIESNFSTPNSKPKSSTTNGSASKSKTTNGSNNNHSTKTNRFSDFFETFFGHGSPFNKKTETLKRKYARTQNGYDLETDLEVTLEELYFGATKSFELLINQKSRLRRNKIIRKRYDVKLPRGTRHGTCIRLKGQGAKKNIGGSAGDLYIYIKVLPHTHMSVKDYDVELDVPVTPFEAALGAWIEIPTLEGAMNIRLPAGSSSGKRVKLRGKGLSKKNNLRGDQYVNFTISVPQYLSEPERRIYQSLSKLSKHNPREKLFNE